MTSMALCRNIRHRVIGSGGYENTTLLWLKKRIFQEISTFRQKACLYLPTVLDSLNIIGKIKEVIQNQQK